MNREEAKADRQQQVEEFHARLKARGNYNR